MARYGSRVWLTKKSLPITAGEYWPALKPTHSHHESNYSNYRRNQQQEIRCFPFEYLTDVDCAVLRFACSERMMRIIIGSSRYRHPIQYHQRTDGAFL